MINLHAKIVPHPARIEPSWSPVGRASDWATEAGGGEEYSARDGLLFEAMSVITALFLCVLVELAGIVFMRRF